MFPFGCLCRECDGHVEGKKNVLHCLLQKRYPNRPIVEFEIAAQEQMKITELRLANLFSTKTNASMSSDQFPVTTAAKKTEGTLEKTWPFPSL